MSKHPIDTVRWLPRSRLRANDYNPNAQAEANHRLLVESIEADGWTQPVVVRPAGEDGMHVIVDGEHRWRASGAFGEESEVPVVILEGTPAENMASTVRHNRARGVHGIEAMLGIVKRLREEGATDGQIEAMLGMSPSERKRLEVSEEMFLVVAAGEDRSMEV